jgi:rhamnosyltransferase
VSEQQRVAAVVTTFNGGESIRPNLERIAAQVHVVVVVDDSGDSARTTDVDYAWIKNAVILRNECNLGIAAALNRGVAHAGLLGCDWVITLDDDTLVSTSYIDDVLNFARMGTPPSIGLIACSREDGESLPGPDGAGFRIKRTLITSGSVFDIKVFNEIGGFDESLFIDLVDFDFCTRLRESGRILVLLNKVGMAHKVGNSRVARFLGLTVLVYNHAPFRLYYQMRNVFFFARKHWAFDPLLSSYLLLDVFRLPLKALFYEREKRARFFYLAHGLLDGLRGRAGRLAKRFGDS